jgi:fructokinase
MMAELCRLNTLVKISDVDWSRLYEGDAPAPEAVMDHFLKMGATEICYTLGENGCWVGNSDEKHFLPARNVEVKDTTGAGDAFWSGYLTAKLDGRTLLECALAGRKMAELKLAHFGPLPDKVDRAVVYEDFGDKT